MTLQKWGGLASFLLVVTSIAASFIYFTGNLRSALGPLSYDLADFMYGPVWAASLVAAVFAMRERFGELASRRTTLALLAAALAAGAMLSVAAIRSTNRHYHLLHPELNLEFSSSVLIVWTTLIAGLTAAGLHFLGWSLLLLASAGWTTQIVPRGLSLIYLLGGIVAFFVYTNAELENLAVLLAIVWGIWQGIWLWNSSPGEHRLAVL